MAWQVCLEGAWQQMAPEDVVQMDEFFGRGMRHFQIVSRGQVYNMDLRSFPWTQTNAVTGRTRAIRYFGAPVPPSPLLPCGPGAGHAGLDAPGGLRVSLASVNWRQVRVLAVICLVVQLFWDTPLVYPLKLLVVFMHETSHGIAAVLTGGSVDSITISPQEGGACFTRGGSRLLILTAGYLGSMLWGGLILILACRTRLDQYISIALGVMTTSVGLVFVRPLVSFGQLFVLISGTALIVMGRLFGEEVNDLVLKVIGLTSCMYAVLDIKSDVLDRPYLRSDASMMAEATGIPTVIWGALWILVAIVGSCYFLLFASQSTPGGAVVGLPLPRGPVAAE